jgi:hypothetical protein
VLFLHGMSLPAGTLPEAAMLDQWVADGFTAARLTVTMAPDGTFPAIGTTTAGGSQDPGLDELAATARVFADRGFRVVLHVSPIRPGSAVAPASLNAAIARLAATFADTGGLVGFEVDTQPAAAPLGDLFSAVRQSDPYHLLWWQDATPLDPGVRVARNDAAAYLVDWGNPTLDGVARLTHIAEVAHISWFYDTPPGGMILPALTRPYPAAVAGIPLAFAAEDSGAFSLSYSTAPAGGGVFAPGVATAVVLPAVAYPNGYRVQAVGAQVRSAPGSNVLCLVAEPGAGQVQVRVEPADPGTATPVQPAGSVATCAAPPVAAASGAASASASTPTTGQAGQAGQAPGTGGMVAAGAPAGRTGGDDPALLVLFPLLGAVGMALALGGAFGLLRRGRPTRPSRDTDVSLP